MNFKQITIFLSLFVLLIAISSVNAADIQEDVATLQQDNGMTTETVQANDDLINTRSVEKTVKKDTDKITYTADNYSDLVSKVNSAKTASSEVVISLNPGNYNATAAITWSGSSNKKLTIDGNGLVLDGQGKFKFMTISANNYLTLRNVTLQNYKSSGPGGTIQCMGQINIEDSIFVNNTVTSVSGGVLNVQDFTGKLSTINNCQFIGNTALKGSAGAIQVNMASLIINNTQFINNSAAGSTSYGGALYNIGSTSIYNSLFEGNNNSNIGGAIATDNKMNLTNVTFKDNYATRYAGAVYFGNNFLNVTDSNFVNNSAGINGGALTGASGTLNVENSNFTNNSAPDGGAVYSEAGSTITIVDSNFTGDSATNGGAIYATGATVTLVDNVFEDITSSTNPVLLPDCEQTIIDGNSYVYTVSNYAGLIAAVNSAKNADSEVVISLSPGNYNATAAIIWGGSSNKKLTIDGNGLVLDGQNKFKFMTVQMNNYLTLKNVTLQNYKSSGPGGTIQCMGQINIEDSIFVNNTASSGPAGVLNVQDFTGKLSTIDNCQFIGNKALNGVAGAVQVNMANLVINNTQFINNSAAGSTSSGGALYNMGSTSIYNSLFEGNNNSNIGGAITTDNKMNLTNVTFKDNYATRYAGAIYFGNNALNVTDSNFVNNSAGSKGGALMGSKGTLNVENSNFTDNSAPDGGAVYSEAGSTITIVDSNFTGDSATNGGAIYATGATVTLTDNVFEDISSSNEVILLPNSKQATLTGNSYIDCDMVGTLTLTSDSEGQTVTKNTPITLNINQALEHPEYYDEDLAEKTEYQIFINDENTYNVTGTEFTFSTDELGEMTIYVYSPLLQEESNEITINIGPGYELTVDDITAKIGDTINITSTITNNGEIASYINEGKVVFKVNGKTIKDENGKVIYVKVKNGQAILENFIVPESWDKEGLTITAVYSGSSRYESLRSDNATITISTLDEITITTQDVTGAKGTNVTLKATIKAGNTLINEGKVVFKVNGKTVKGSDGKTIYLDVKNGEVSVVYTIASTMKAKNYEIRAVYVSSSTDKIEGNATLTVTK